MAPANLEQHFLFLIGALKAGSLVPLLGAGVNMSGRGSTWSESTRFLPSGQELANYLAAKYNYKEKERDLLRVSQFVALTGSPTGLYRELHSLFEGDHEPGAVHRLLAAIPKMLSEDGETPKYQLILTTNYDRALECAFDEVDEPYHLLWYLSEGENNGKFMHRPPRSAAAKLIEDPNEYDEVSTEECTVICKIHGGVGDAGDAPESESYVITEDDYLDYLTHSTEIAQLFPALIALHLLGAEFLFLGYNLRDWNLRVILNRIWQAQSRTLSRKSWAIQRRPKPLDRLFWADRKVDILDIDLDEYIREFRQRLGLPAPAEREVEAGA